MRTYEEVQAAIDKLRGKQVAGTVSALPPGFKIGCKLSLAGNVVTIGVGMMELKGTAVKFGTAYQILGEDWVCERIPGGTYYIYIDEGRTVRVDSLEPIWNNTYMEMYHPYSQWRHGGTILTDTVTGRITQIINAGALVAGDIDTTTLETVYAIIAFSEADPAQGSHRVYIDRNEVSLQLYDPVSAEWGTYLKLGGDEASYIYGEVFPYLQARGLIKTGAIDETVALDVGDIVPSNYVFYDFENDYEDNTGTDPWDTKTSLEFSATSKFGTYSLHGTAVGAILRDNAIWTAGTAAGATCAAWVKYSNLDIHTSGAMGLVLVNDLIALETYPTHAVCSIKKNGALISTNINKVLTTGWHFFAFSYDLGTDTAVYVVDDQSTTLTPGGAWAGENCGLILSLAGGASDPYTAYMDDMLVSYTTAMSAADLLAHYQTNQPWAPADGIDYSKDIILIPKDTGKVVMPPEAKWRVKSVSSANYTVTDLDCYDWIDVTTGASDRTITWPTVADNVDRILGVRKVDSGVGKVINDGEGAEVFISQGNSYATFELLQIGDFAIFKGNGTGWDKINSPYWHLIADPGTDWLISKVAGWTANSFTGGLEVDFSSVVPAGTRAARCVIQGYNGDGSVYWRPSGDTNISNTPVTTKEYSHFVFQVEADGVQQKIHQVVMWLSSDYKAQIAVEVTDQKINVSYPVEYLQ